MNKDIKEENLKITTIGKIFGIVCVIFVIAFTISIMVATTTKWFFDYCDWLIK
jgi:hypothetical protein